MDEFDFSKWAEDAGLSKDTIQLLTTEELCTFNAMEAFYGSFNEEAHEHENRSETLAQKSA